MLRPASFRIDRHGIVGRGSFRLCEGAGDDFKIERRAIGKPITRAHNAEIIGEYVAPRAGIGFLENSTHVDLIIKVEAPRL